MISEVTMGAWRRFFGGLTAEEFEGALLGSDAGWEVAPTKDSVKFFQSLPVILPPGAVMYFEATALAPDLREFFDEHPAPVKCKVHAGTRWPYPEIFHIAYSPAIVRNLAAVAKDFADAEICDHFLAYHDKRILLEWFDAWFNPLYLSRQISEPRVAEFCVKIGSGFKKCDVIPRAERRFGRN